jgi:hypothetical protein
MAGEMCNVLNAFHCTGQLEDRLKSVHATLNKLLDNGTHDASDGLP